MQHEVLRSDLKKAIPSHCFESSTAKSVSYFLFDLSVITLLYVLMYLLHPLPLWALPLFWFALGTMFWALFVIGHDCGHGSFSKKSYWNRIFGYICHAPLLVPFHSWLVSHTKHHLYTNSIENDEVFRVFSESEYTQLGGVYRFVRFKLFLFFFPLYLMGVLDTDPRHWPKNSHFHPRGRLFKQADYFPALCSTFSCILVLSGIILLGYHFGWLFVLTYYGMPYIVFIAWLSLVTFLQHTDISIPSYRQGSFNNLKGSLSSIDRDYGVVFNFLQHNINVHVIHHLFPNIPHYHLKEATKHIIPLLGSYYLHPVSPSIIISFFISARDCRFVPDTGDTVYYVKPDKVKNQKT